MTRKGTFSYPGGKTVLSGWIVDNIPDHHLYVELFGGSGAVLMNKPPSQSEVYNDINSDCVKFFEAVKKKPDELNHWIENTPFSRELFEEWSNQFGRGERPEDLVEWAGRFIFLTTTAFGSKIYQSSPSMSVYKTNNEKSLYGPERWKRQADRVYEIRDRFKDVQIECSDYKTIIDRYDSEDTFFYCDPPYIGMNNYYAQKDGFDHDEFCSMLCDIEGLWAVSYGEELPDVLKQFNVSWRGIEQTMTMDASERDECLVTNYDPDKTQFTRVQSVFDW